MEIYRTSGVGTRRARGQMVGNIRVLEAVFSPELGNARDVLVYLPPTYRTSGRHYPVIYMHDGQNLFDPTTAFAGEWQVDDTLERLGREGVECIVVGIPNMGRSRVDEYSPFHEPGAGGGQGWAYLDFVVNTLKTEIDARFRTRRERTHTGIMGSSLGGLISLVAFFRHPGVFGFAGIMSPSLWFADAAVFDYVARHQRWSGRLYLDIGTLEGKAHVRYARLMAQLLRRMAVRPRMDLLFVRDRRGRHDEAAWASRFERAVRFLLPKAPADLHW